MQSDFLHQILNGLDSLACICAMTKQIQPSEERSPAHRLHERGSVFHHDIKLRNADCCDPHMNSDLSGGSLQIYDFIFSFRPFVSQVLCLVVNVNSFNSSGSSLSARDKRYDGCFEAGFPECPGLNS